MDHAEPVRQYAFSSAYIRQEQQLLAKDSPDVVCVGKVKVTMRSGAPGYRFMRCTSELDNPATTWWFYITSDGRVHVNSAMLT